MIIVLAILVFCFAYAVAAGNGFKQIHIKIQEAQIHFFKKVYKHT